MQYTMFSSVIPMKAPKWGKQVKAGLLGDPMSSGGRASCPAGRVSCLPAELAPVAWMER